MPHSPAVIVKNISFAYRKGVSLMLNRKPQEWTLQNISLQVRRGEAIGVIGRNGQGKSTLLKLLAGIYKPDSGLVERRIQHSALLSLQVGFVNHLSGRDNVVLSAILQGMPRKQALKIVDDVIELSELGEHIDYPIKTYSAGMRTRLGFAIAMQLQPELLLIDEVLGVGDAPPCVRIPFASRSLSDLTTVTALASP
ncbi:MAG: ATP-binding cassette domain-containing protein [gamma proteobacterium symbiont of Bathyaustriella thionipta]|nr:ATP-binding cassette domain-containing protein [gamma proteobacterium symbiont of Bathyaustriella thionipta]